METTVCITMPPKPASRVKKYYSEKEFEEILKGLKSTVFKKRKSAIWNLRKMRISPTYAHSSFFKNRAMRMLGVLAQIRKDGVGLRTKATKASRKLGKLLNSSNRFVQAQTKTITKVQLESDGEQEEQLTKEESFQIQSNLRTREDVTKFYNWELAERARAPEPSVPRFPIQNVV